MLPSEDRRGVVLAERRDEGAEPRGLECRQPAIRHADAKDRSRLRGPRQFLYVGDAARGLLLAAERLDTSEPVNLGTGRETSIRELAEQIESLVGYEGETVWDTSQPDGQPRRFLDVSRARDLMGFGALVPLAEGLGRTIESFRATAATSS